MISIQQTTLHNKSPSPRGRQIKAQFLVGNGLNGGQGQTKGEQTSALQFGLNSIVPGQRNSKQLLQTDPKNMSVKAKDVIGGALASSQMNTLPPSTL